MMTDKFYVPQDGTIEDAVATIQPGGTIKISAGRYVLKETLLIEKPLRLEGAGIENTFVVSTSSADLIRVMISGKFSVEGLSFQYEEIIKPSSSDDNKKPLSSILRIDAGIADVSNCKFAGHVNLKANGIALFGESRGCIKGNEVNNFFFGISSRMDTYAEFIGNRCEENLFGIALIGSGSVADNFCRLNEQSGIIVNGEASPEIIRNRCEENKFGISFFDSSTGSATENVCRLNSEYGILVTGEASPVISNNRCEENESGIVFSGSSSGSAMENVCRLNSWHGILVTDEASPVISGNRCEENNVCNWHKSYGILVNGEASPVISGNYCKLNIVGIGFFDSCSGSVADNYCCFNALYGILVKEQASPELSRNRCHDNNNDIAFHDSSSGSATENICRYDIIVSGKASPVISGNRVEGTEFWFNQKFDQIIEAKDSDQAWINESEKVIKFSSFQEAKNWSIENPGKVFTKSPDGTGYIIKNI